MSAGALSEALGFASAEQSGPKIPQQQAGQASPTAGLPKPKQLDEPRDAPPPHDVSVATPPRTARDGHARRVALANFHPGAPLLPSRGPPSWPDVRPTPIQVLDEESEIKNQCNTVTVHAPPPT